MKKLLIALGILGLIGTAHAVSVFNSGQVGTGAASGSVLQTNGTVSTWVPTSSLGISGGSSLTSTYFGYGSGSNTILSPS